MILKKDEKDNTIENVYNSSNVFKSKYNKISGDLIIIYQSGLMYEYKKVNPTDYYKLELSDSIGKAIHKYIKKYQTNKIGTMDKDSIKEEINNILKDLL